MIRYRLRTLLIVLAVIAGLVALGAIRLDRRGVGRAIRDVNRIAPDVERRNQNVRDLASP